MNSFAWSITFKWNVPLNIKTKDFVSIKNLTIVWDSNIYFYGETKLNSKNELLDYFKENISSEIIASDLSISTEDKIEILDLDEIDWEYWLMTVSWIDADFDEVLESFSENEEVVCVREWEINKFFWTKDIKVDIIP